MGMGGDIGLGPVWRVGSFEKNEVVPHGERQGAGEGEAVGDDDNIAVTLALDLFEGRIIDGAPEFDLEKIVDR